MKTIQARRTRHPGHCWRSRDILLWTPTYSRAKAGRTARTYIQQLCEDTECNPEDLPEAKNDREKCRERIRDIRAGGMSWWWYIYIYVYIYICMYKLSQYTWDPCDLSNNNVVFIFVSDLKIVYKNNYYFSIIMPWTRKEQYFASQFGDKILQNCLKIDATHLYVNVLLLRQETEKKKRLHVRKTNIITIKNTDLMSLDQRIYKWLSLVLWVECSPMAQKTGVQSQVESNQRLKKTFLIHPCLMFSIIRYVSRVNPGEGVAPSRTLSCSNYWKGSFWVAFDYDRQLTLEQRMHFFTRQPLRLSQS